MILRAFTIVSKNQDECKLQSTYKFCNICSLSSLDVVDGWSRRIRDEQNYSNWAFLELGRAQIRTRHRYQATVPLDDNDDDLNDDDDDDGDVDRPDFDDQIFGSL